MLTILDVPSGGALPIQYERSQAAPLSAEVAAIRHRVSGSLRSLGWLPKRRTATRAAKALTVGFYAPWDDASRVSLAAHLDAIDWVVPVNYSVTGADHRIVQFVDPRFDRLMAAAQHRPLLMPVVQNVYNDHWDGANAARLFRDRAARHLFLARLGTSLMRRHAGGVVFDFETLPREAIPDYRRLLADARTMFAPHDMLVTVTVPAGDAAWDLRAIAQVTDRVFLMDYDEHSEAGDPGPIASQPWFLAHLSEAITAVGRDKLIVAIGNYGYDWHGKDVDPVTAEEAWLAAHDSGATVRFDPASGNSTFGYRENGQDHVIWMLDAASAWNNLRGIRAMGVNAVALWRLGSEDPGFWADLASWQGGAMPDLSVLKSVANTDVEGNGEILRIAAVPQDGSRTVTVDRQQLIRDEQYHNYPTPYVVERTGDRAKLVALTFDDGPNATWTPQILDALSSRHAVGTFFVVGESALPHPLLIRRILAQGSEIGNHSYTHPNMALMSSGSIGFELNMTQRLIEAYTGRATKLFRAPYFGDAEPTTGDELGPALDAQKHGYTIVGLHVDPNDWQKHPAANIVDQVVGQVTSATADRSGNVVLLHDGGGNREQTVLALPAIIDRLRALGYQFVPVSTLAGLTRDQVMPPIGGSDLLAVRLDVGIFAALAMIGWILVYMFALAIGLGIARALIIAALALWNHEQSKQIAVPAIDRDRLVSVIIPAFNEARVIVRSVSHVLASTDASIEVIVADDGSTDGTGKVVSEAFGNDARVRLLSLANGGKASALNRALNVARGEIIVALDADTQFEPGTVALLTRWFADPAIGAVAGNAKVGNCVNLVTRWQAVEYVTAQNLERRALSQFHAMMVVPGAVGAWRRAALRSVGGYPEDTLAEDQDLTIAIQRAGWRIAYDVEAVAWTEAPERLSALARQRYRWAFGTLQCLWKHRAILRLRQPRGLAFVGMPQAWAFQIVFAAISPVIDLALLLSIGGTALRISQHGWDQTQSDVLMMATYWLAFVGIDLMCGWIAFRLEPRRPRFPGHLLIAQRFVYRQVMYWVVLRSIGAAIGGLGVGWGRQERSGNVSVTPVEVL